jgi:large subunit ribosomal protein L46
VDYAEWRAQLTDRRAKVLPKELIEPKGTEESSSTLGSESGGGRWEPSPRETNADRAGDRRTPHRRLDQRIFLLLRPSVSLLEKSGPGITADGKVASSWQFPSVILDPEETTRSGAERALKEALGSEGFQPFFVGNAPAGHLAAAHSTLFFHRCQLIKGRPGPLPGGIWSDHVWVAKDELAEYITDPPLLQLLQKML